MSRRLMGPDGRDIALKPKIFDTLVALAVRPGHVVTKTELMDAVWPGVVVEENNLNQAISALRKALGDSDGKRLIVTVPGRGFQLAVQVNAVTVAQVTPPGTRTAPTVPLSPREYAPIFAAAAGSPEAKPAPDATQAITPSQLSSPPSATGLRGRPRGRMLLIVGLAAAMILVGWAAIALWRPVGGARALEPSLAVLPFANLSGDPEQDYVAQGIAGELIETLSQIDRLKVVGRGSSFSYEPHADPRKVGPELHVANVLSGGVSQQNGVLRISFELADAASGQTIVSRTYTADLTTDNVAAAQRYVAEQVAGALSIAFDIRGGRQLQGAGTRSLEAYDFYLQGREAMYLQGREAIGVTGTSDAESLFAKAVAADPDYGAAWGLLAIAHGSRSWDRPTPAEGRAEQDAAYAMAKKAISLDPDISTSQAVFANLATTQHNWIEAEIASRRALDLSVNEVALAQRQYILLRAGRITEAAALYAAIDQVAPRAAIGVPKNNTLPAIGRLDELRAMIATPEWTKSGSVRAQAARLEALIDLRAQAAEVRGALEAIARQPDRSLSEFAKAVLAVFGDNEKARRVLRTWYEGQGFENANKYELIPFLAAWYDDTDLVLRVWRDDLPVNVVRMTQVWGPAYAHARSRPEFKALMQEMGLVDYWRAYKWADKCRPVGATDFECG